MKNLNQIAKVACVAFIMLFTCENVSAAIVTVDGTNDGTYYLCPGVAYEIFVTNCPTNFDVKPDAQYWVWCTPTICPTAVYTAPTTYSSDDAQNLTMTAGTEVLDIIPTDPNRNNGFTVVLTFITIKTTMTGLTDFCVGSQNTYTATSTYPSVSSWSWTIPSFVSGSSTTSSITLTDNSGGGPSALTVVANGTGCPTNNSGITATKNLTSHTSAPAAPSGTLTYRQYNNSCLFYASISAVSGATSYEWSLDNFATIWRTTTLPNSGAGSFDYSTNYDVYVKAGNCVGYSAKTHWNKTTPAKPAGCTQIRTGRLARPFEENPDYKVYPNPVSTNLTIEYPSSDINDIRLNVYDILGHKVASWILPNTENMVTEDTSTLPTGIYLYVINSGDGVLTRGKLMIQR